MDAMLLDLRVILRGWRRSPAVTLLAVAILGLGVGVLTGLLTLLQGVVIDRLPVRAPEELVKLVVDRGEDGVNNNLSHPLLQAVRAGGVPHLAGVVGHSSLPLALDAGGGAERVQGAVLTPDAFAVLGVPVALGSDLRTAPSRGVVLSHALWQRRFGGERAVLGREVELNGHPFVVVGVAPPAFRGLATGAPAELWAGLPAYTTLVPDSVSYFDQARASWVDVFARRRAGEADAALAPRLAAWSEILRREGLLNPGETLAAVSGARGLTWMVDELARPLLVLNLLALLLLLLVAANFAGLVAARAAGRGAELAVRASLGAHGGRLLRLLLLESLLVALAGALLALPVALATARGLLAFPSPFGERIAVPVALDARLLATAAGLALLAGLAAAALPALRASRVPLAPVLRGLGAGMTGMPRARRALVVVQTALAVTLLCAAALFARTVQRLATVDVGYETSGVVLARLEPVTAGYDRERAAALWLRLLPRVEALPGVEAAALASNVAPSPFGMRWGGFTVEGHAAPDEGTEADVVVVSPGWFATLGVPLTVGRPFEPRDAAGAPEVAVVNQAFVRRYVGGGDPRGAHVLDGPADDPATRRLEIVGVVPDAPVRDLREAVPPVLLRPLGQERMMGGALLVRSRLDAGSLLPLLRRELAALEPGVPLFDAQPLAAHAAAASGRERMVALIGALFGLLALLVAALGLYALLTWFVLQQRREMAVRSVLGAGGAQVRRMILGRGLRLVAVGAALGIAGALALGRAVRGTLYGVEPSDPAALAVGALTLVLASLAACWAPARRAARVEPMTALKEP